MRISIPIPNRILVVAAALAAGALVGFGVARAAIPADANALVYTGVPEKNGALVDDTLPIDVSVFDDATPGNLLCGPVSQPSATVSHGRFSAPLPSSCVNAIRGHATAFVEVKVGGVAVGARTPIGAVPFAIEAGHADSATLADDAATLPAGAVMAFDLDACPPGWSPFAAAADHVV